MLATARAEEQFQAIGLLCREALISLAQAVYDPVRHPSIDGIASSDTDARRMLGAYIAEELVSGPNEEARAHARAALRLAVAHNTAHGRFPSGSYVCGGNCHGNQCNRHSIKAPRSVDSA